MTFTKHWTAQGEKEMIRNKPYAGDDSDYLDSINEAWAEDERTRHHEGLCGGLDDHCPHCEADKQAEEEARHYQSHVFDRLGFTFKKAGFER